MSATNKHKYGLADLLYLMQRLRDPNTGCPWDIKQNFASIVPHTIEEAYEVADVIEREAWHELPAELGDLLFQVVYYAQMAQEQQRFDFAAVVNSAVTKLLYRHPHVFPDGLLYGQQRQQEVDESGLDQQWQQLKAAEQQAALSSILDGVPTGLPALTRAVKLQKRAAKVGFDWAEAAQVLAKVDEELAELRQAIAGQEQAQIEHELGDLLNAVTNLARHLQLDPEQALRRANHRFTQRFNYIEQRLAEQGLELDACDLELLDGLWDEAKQHLS